MSANLNHIAFATQTRFVLTCKECGVQLTEKIKPDCETPVLEFARGAESLGWVGDVCINCNKPEKRT